MARPDEPSDRRLERPQEPPAAAGAGLSGGAASRLVRGRVVWRRLRRLAAAAVQRRMRTEMAELSRRMSNVYGQRRPRRPPHRRG